MKVPWALTSNSAPSLRLSVNKTPPSSSMQPAPNTSKGYTSCKAQRSGCESCESHSEEVDTQQDLACVEGWVVRLVCPVMSLSASHRSTDVLAEHTAANYKCSISVAKNQIRPQQPIVPAL